MDVWQSAWGTTGWQSPVNPGTPLNGAGNDRDPFFASDDLLYFASDRAGGQGGYDFWTWFPTVPLVAPQNFGVPLNTASDELSPRFTADMARMFLSSDRGGDFDVLFADLWEPQIHIFDQTDPALRGSEVTYTITVWNLASAAASFPNTTVTATYDTGMTFVSSSPAPRIATNNIWDLGSLAFDDPDVIDDGFTIDITVLLDPSIDPAATPRLEVTVSNDNSDDVTRAESTDLLFQPYLPALFRDGSP